MATTAQRATRRKVTIAVGPKTTKAEIDRLFERLYKLSGCLKCGLGGFDIDFAGPVVNPELGDFENLSVDIRTM